MELVNYEADWLMILLMCIRCVKFKFYFVSISLVYSFRRTVAY